MTLSARRRWLRQLVDSSGGDSVVTVESVARRVVGDPSLFVAHLSDPPDGWADPWLIGAVHELLASAGERSARGAWYTPRAVVEQLVELALPTADVLPASAPGIIDPTCGGGAFLLAVLDRLVVLGSSPDEALDRVAAMDIDAGAVHAARLAIDAWGRLRAASPAVIQRAVARIRLGDQLTGWPDDWPSVGAVLGNPPFATPLRGRPFPAAAQLARDDRRDRLGPYADLAAIHLVLCVERVAPGGRVCLVVPQSMLGGRDTAGMRAWIDDVAPMADLWATKEPVFEASVRVWSPLLVKRPIGASSVPTAVTSVPGAVAASWSEAVALAVGVPKAVFGSNGTLDALLTTATAGFRDEFYALAEACVELDEVSDDGVLPDGFVRLATVGSLDPLTSWWGRRPTVFAKRRWVAPVIDCARVEGRSQSWLTQMRAPKVLLPTQSKIFEPFVDRHGVVAPATPLLALHADADAIDLVAAVFLAPPVVAWAFGRWFGTAMSVEAIKIAARDLGGFPLPGDRGAWREAAALIASADDVAPDTSRQIAVEAARIMHRAYGAGALGAVDDQVWQWWLARASTSLPSRA